MRKVSGTVGSVVDPLDLSWLGVDLDSRNRCARPSATRVLIEDALRGLGGAGAGFAVPIVGRGFRSSGGMVLRDAAIPCSSSEKTVEPDDIATLAAAESINLGAMGSLSLISNIPCNYVPSISKDEMKETYLSVFMDSKTLGWDVAHSNVRGSFHQDKVMGLFWDDGWGYAHRAILHAIVLLHTFADFGVDVHNGKCNYDALQLRERIEAGTFPLDIMDTGGQPGTITQDATGFVTSFMNELPPRVAWTYFGVMHFNTTIRLEAALADVYFWWAWRCLGYYQDYGNFIDLLTGLACARAGMAEIVDIAGNMLHEWGHVVGPSYHCYSPFSGRDCCQYFLDWSFKNRSMAAMCVPESHHFNWHSGNSFSDTGVTDRFDGRFEPYSLPTYHGSPESNLSSSDCSEADATFTHESLWVFDHDVTLVLTIPDGCASGSGGDFSDTQTL